jgi:hypothetical protein
VSFSGQQIPRRPCQAIQARHHEHVARLDTISGNAAHLPKSFFLQEEKDEHKSRLLARQAKDRQPSSGSGMPAKNQTRAALRIGRLKN